MLIIKKRSKSGVGCDGEGQSPLRRVFGIFCRGAKVRVRWRSVNRHRKVRVEALDKRRRILLRRRKTQNIILSSYL